MSQTPTDLTSPNSGGSDALREEIRARLTAGNYPDLNLHLLSMHANGAALMLSEADAENQHTHEHTGPGTIRNHPISVTSWDLDAAATVLMEAVEMDTTEGDDPMTAVERLMTRDFTSETDAQPVTLLNRAHWAADYTPGEQAHMVYRRLRDALDADPIIAMFASPLVDRLASAMAATIAGKNPAVQAPETLNPATARDLALQVIWLSPLSLLHERAIGYLADQIRDALFPLTAARTNRATRSIL